MVDHRRREWLRLNGDDAVVDCAVVVVDWIWVIKIDKRIHFSEEHMISRGLDFRAVSELRVERRVGQKPRGNLHFLVVMSADAATGVGFSRQKKIENRRGLDH